MRYNAKKSILRSTISFKTHSDTGQRIFTGGPGNGARQFRDECGDKFEFSNIGCNAYLLYLDVNNWQLFSVLTWKYVIRAEKVHDMIKNNSIIVKK